MLKDAKINFVIQNVPDIGTNKDNNQPEAITAKAIHDTMNQFGKVNNAVVFRKHAYIWFDSIKDAKVTHKLLNGMAIEKNIINFLDDITCNIIYLYKFNSNVKIWWPIC